MNEKMINLMAKELINLKMGLNMQVSGRMIYSMVLEKNYGKVKYYYYFFKKNKI